ncbi:hypothetical protein RYD26_12475 [Pasteurellaceae bacterium LIM206]|nr:hypothetical protein [Pasteurellaceae bacterium LIM206]
MKTTYFIYRDSNAMERQSDGVEFCKIPEFFDDKIYFYCNEYMLFWTSIDDAGDLNKAKDFKLKDRIIPATLLEICNEGLIGYINIVKQYNIEDGKILGITYINLD